MTKCGEGSSVAELIEGTRAERRGPNRHPTFEEYVRARTEGNEVRFKGIEDQVSGHTAMFHSMRQDFRDALDDERKARQYMAENWERERNALRLHVDGGFEVFNKAHAAIMHQMERLYVCQIFLMGGLIIVGLIAWFK